LAVEDVAGGDRRVGLREQGFHFVARGVDVCGHVLALRFALGADAVERGADFRGALVEVVDLFAFESGERDGIDGVAVYGRGRRIRRRRWVRDVIQICVGIVRRGVRRRGRGSAGRDFFRELVVAAFVVFRFREFRPALPVFLSLTAPNPSESQIFSSDLRPCTIDMLATHQPKHATIAKKASGTARCCLCALGERSEL